MTDNDYGKTISQKISENRKSLGLTQGELADRLKVSFQAVLKHENVIPCPDILLLPAIADIFDITIDELFGLNKETQDVKFEEPEKLYIVMYKGNKLIKKHSAKTGKISKNYTGEINDLECVVLINCDKIFSDAAAGSDIYCDEISGDSKDR